MVSNFALIILVVLKVYTNSLKTFDLIFILIIFMTPQIYPL